MGGTAATGGTAGTSGSGGEADGGGLALLGNGAFTMVNSTVATNTVTGGSGGGSATQGRATSGGILDQDTAAVTLDNNTITQNSLNGGTNVGAGILVSAGNPTLVNNLIQANQSSGSALDLENTTGTPLSNASNNFISTATTGAVSTTTNMVGNTQTQLGSAVGVTAAGEASGGPIYYPLLESTVSVGAGSTSVLSTITAVEGTSTATDQIGQPISTSSIDLGAVQSVPSSPPSPPPSPHNFVVTNTSSNASTSGSLPWAVQQANAASGAVNYIMFDIPGSGPQTINLTSTLNLTDQMVIDGTSQPGYSGTPLISIQGSSSVPSLFTLGSGSSGSTIQGLDMYSYTAEAIDLTNSTAGNFIQNNWIGFYLNPSSGQVSLTNSTFNQAFGIDVLSSYNTIRGNVISGNFDGIYLGEIPPRPGRYLYHGNSIQSNDIGTNPSGTTASKLRQPGCRRLCGCGRPTELPRSS